MVQELRPNTKLDSILSMVVAAMLTAALGGCTGLAIGAGATVVTAAAEERGVTGAASDLAIAANVTALWVKYNPNLIADLDVAVSQGRTLLTGTVGTQARRLEAARLTWRTPGVKTVLNEIQVQKSSGIAGYARDSWITTQLVSRLSFDRKVDYINYTVETVNRTVYVMGIAQDQKELDRITTHARHVRYVRGIVSHIKLKAELRQISGGKSAPLARP